MDYQFMESLVSATFLLCFLSAFTVIDGSVVYFCAQLMDFPIKFSRALLVGLATFTIFLFLFVFLYYFRISIHNDMSGFAFLGVVILSQAFVSKLLSGHDETAKMPWVKTFALLFVQFIVVFCLSLYFSNR